MKLRMEIPANRSYMQIRKHYELEKAIATKLKKAEKAERKQIYKTMYDELFAQVTDHPRLTSQGDRVKTSSVNKRKMRLVNKAITKQTIFAEFAPGDCSFANFVSEYVRLVCAIDISDQRLNKAALRGNYQFIIYDGYDIPLGEHVIDVAFSDQLIEHLHPEDLQDHFKMVKRILKKNGSYIIITPHRYCGPHDISMYFSNKAEGFHLKEWSYIELSEYLKSAGYSKLRGYFQAKGLVIRFPFMYFSFMERKLNVLPKKWKQRVSKFFLPRIAIMAKVGNKC